ncbi:MAG: AbgT family transporter, partial [Caldilineaceae bacterium]
MSSATTAEANPSRGLTQRMLDGIETVGNKVPHPVLMFLYLIIIVIVLSHILYLFGVSVTEDIATPVTPPLALDYYEDTTEPGILGLTDPYGVEYQIEQRTIAIR